MNFLKNTLLIIEAQEICTKNYARQKVKKLGSNIFNQKSVKQNEKTIENVPDSRTSMIEENEKIINIVEYILYFNQLEQKQERLKILTPNQMFSRLPISLAQLKAGNNSEKLKNEIRQILYSL